LRQGKGEILLHPMPAAQVLAANYEFGSPSDASLGGGKHFRRSAKGATKLGSL
jgi:hypothetical protein